MFIMVWAGSANQRAQIWKAGYQAAKLARPDISLDVTLSQTGNPFLTLCNTITRTGNEWKWNKQSQDPLNSIYTITLHVKEYFNEFFIWQQFFYLKTKKNYSLKVWTTGEWQIYIRSLQVVGPDYNFTSIKKSLYSPFEKRRLPQNFIDWLWQAWMVGPLSSTCTGSHVTVKKWSDFEICILSFSWCLYIARWTTQNRSQTDCDGFS